MSRIPAITPDYLKSQIVDVRYYRDTEFSPNLTTCSLKTANGCLVQGKSAVLDMARFNEQIGKDIAYKDAFEKLWELEGYARASLTPKLPEGVRIFGPNGFPASEDSQGYKDVLTLIESGRKKCAYFVKEGSYRDGLICHRQYHCVPPMEDSQGGKHDFVVVSTSKVLGVETYIFPSDKDGQITEYLELPGSLKGREDHAAALAAAGYVVLQPKGVGGDDASDFKVGGTD